MTKNKIILITAIFAILIMGLSNISFAANNNAFTFTDDGISALDSSGSGFVIEGTALTINEAGTYTITGNCNEGSVEVKKGTTGVTLILDNLSLTCSKTAPISLNKSTETTIQIKGIVSLTDKEDITTEETNEDFEGACIKLKSGGILTIKGSGTLNIDGSSCKNGIKGGATSKITIDENVIFNIKAANSGIAVDGSMFINSGVFYVESEDGIKSDPDDEDTESLGDLTINGGTFSIKATEDGVRANGKLEINGGTFDITSAEGLEATYVLINDGTININASDDGINGSDKSTRYSIKIEINGGDITIKMGQGDTDALDSNGDLIITGGKLNISAQFAFDYDGKVTFTGGDVTVNGENVTTITSSMMMGGGMPGGMPGGMQGGRPDMNGQRPPEMPSGDFRGQGGRPGMNGQNGQMPPEKPNGDMMPPPEMKEEKNNNASSWAVEELKKAEEKNLVPDSFKGKDLTQNITRQEFAHVIVKLYEALSKQKMTEASDNPFTDTQDAEVLKAYSLGITKGTTETTFSPNDLITREQMATMIGRCLECLGAKLSTLINTYEPFADDNEMHDWSRKAIYFMAQEEVIKGVGNNTFNVKGNATREQALLISERSVEKFFL